MLLSKKSHYSRPVAPRSILCYFNEENIEKLTLAEKHRGLFRSQQVLNTDLGEKLPGARFFQATCSSGGTKWAYHIIINSACLLDYIVPGPACVAGAIALLFVITSNTAGASSWQPLKANQGHYPLFGSALEICASQIMIQCTKQSHLELEI